MNLTKRQKEILEYIQSFLRSQGVAPTVTEISSNFNLRSVATVHKHLKALENRNCIRRSKHRARAIELVGAALSGSAEVAMVGLIAAGQPIEAVVTPETLAIPEDMLGRGETFALKVQGDSMITDGIHEGDFIIVESRMQANDGDIVVALIDREEATVKRLYRHGAQVHLEPSNPVMDTMVYPADRVQIQGVVIGLIRKYMR